MKHSILSKIVSGLLVASALTVANATPIVGSISFLGNATTNGTGSTPLANATAFTGFSGDTVDQVHGDYIVVPTLSGDGVTFTPFAFSTTSVTPLWTFTVLGVTYSFSASGAITVFQNASFLNVSGTGTAFISGYAPTAGTWTIQETETAGSFSFGATSGEVATTPDSGTTALLISLGLAGIALGVVAQRRNQVKA
jgi:hypothetical protein